MDLLLRTYNGKNMQEFTSEHRIIQLAKFILLTFSIFGQEGIIFP